MGYKIFFGIVVFIILVLALIFIKPSFFSVSQYCKSLPNNAVNTVSLTDDSAGCPHWYIEIRSIKINCFCIGNRICEGDEEYIPVLEGCSGASSPCQTCPIYAYTPIADYGGLLGEYNCTKDLTQTCSDGTVIIQKQCVEGLYVTTNNSCSKPCENCNPNIKVYVGIGLIAIALLTSLYFIIKDLRRKK